MGPDSSVIAMKLPYDRNASQGYRPQPWRPPVSTDAPTEKSKCLGDLVREQAEREGRIGSPTIGCPSDEQRFIESWHARHPEKAPTNPLVMAAVKKAEKMRKSNELAKAKRKGKRKGERKAVRNVIETTAAWNRGRRKPTRKVPSLHNRALLLPHRNDRTRSVRGKPPERFAVRT
jgi:hypothetical protein